MPKNMQLPLMDALKSTMERVSESLKRKQKDSDSKDFGDSGQAKKAKMTEKMRKTFQWNIPIKSLLGGKVEHLFDTNGIKWIVFLQPMPLIEDKLYYGLFLKLDPNQGNSQAILDKADDLIASFTADLFHPGSIEPLVQTIGINHNFKKQPIAVGWKNFVAGGKLNAGNFLDKELKLNLTFSVKLNFDGQEEEEAVRKKQMQDSCDKCQSQIFNSIRKRQYPDVILKTIDDEELNAIRFVLCARSNYFEAMFKDPSSIPFQNGRYMVAVQFPLKIMRVILCHIQTGYIPEVLINPAETDLETAKELAQAASMFDLLDLHAFLMEYHPLLKAQQD